MFKKRSYKKESNFLRRRIGIGQWGIVKKLKEERFLADIKGKFLTEGW